MSLTGAELRLLPYLATHLTFPEIASRLFISRNTVKTEAVSIYRKLGASSRSEAIERAIEVGLLEELDHAPVAQISSRRDEARAASTESNVGVPMDDYKQHLRRLAVHDETLRGRAPRRRERAERLGPRSEDRSTRTAGRDHRRRRGARLRSSTP